jgi:hypothetical protein
MPAAAARILSPTATVSRHSEAIDCNSRRGSSSGSCIVLASDARPRSARSQLERWPPRTRLTRSRSAVDRTPRSAAVTGSWCCGSKPDPGSRATPSAARDGEPVDCGIELAWRGRLAAEAGASLTPGRAARAWGRRTVLGNPRRIRERLIPAPPRQAGAATRSPLVRVADPTASSAGTLASGLEGEW